MFITLNELSSGEVIIKLLIDVVKELFTNAHKKRIVQKEFLKTSTKYESKH